MAANFDFLKGSDSKLYETGHRMEDDFFSDTEGSAKAGSEFLDLLVREIYDREGFEYVSKSFMTKDIAELAEKGIIDEKTLKEFEKAKLIRDEIIDKEEYSFDRVLALHSVLVVLASWFFNRYEK